jgi:hypothetical protein
VDRLLQRLARLDEAGQDRDRLPQDGWPPSSSRSASSTTATITAGSVRGKWSVSQATQWRAKPPLITFVGPPHCGHIGSRWCHWMIAAAGRSDVPLVVTELEPHLAQIVDLALGEGLHSEDGRSVEQTEESVPLAVELDERPGHPQLAAARCWW